MILTERNTVPEKPGQKSEQHNGRGGTQRSGDPKKTKAILEKPGQKKTKAERGCGGTQRSGDPKKKSCPRQASLEKQKHTRDWGGTREAGTLKKLECPMGARKQQQQELLGCIQWLI